MVRQQRGRQKHNLFLTNQVDNIPVRVRVFGESIETVNAAPLAVDVRQQLPAAANPVAAKGEHRPTPLEPLQLQPFALLPKQQALAYRDLRPRHGALLRLCTCHAGKQVALGAQHDLERIVGVRHNLIPIGRGKHRRRKRPALQQLPDCYGPFHLAVWAARAPSQA